MLTNISDQRLVPGRSEVGTILLALLAAGCADAGSLEPLTLDLNADSAPASLANALQLETGGSAAIEALRGPLTDADWVVRAWAVAILGRLGEQLDLGEEQRTQVEALGKEFGDKRRELIEAARAGEIERSEIRERLQELGAQLNEKILKLLTEEQRTRYAELRRRR